MVNTTPSKAADITLTGPFDASQVRSLRSKGRINCLNVTDQPVLTAKIARGFGALSSVRWLRLWCPTTRTALRHVLPIPGLKILEILKIRHPGMLESLELAVELDTFRCDWLSEGDVIAIARLPNLVQLDIQAATLSRHALDAILRIPGLRRLDLEATNLNDNMAEALSSSPTIESLEIGATHVTKAGLKSICKMSQLRRLDIWALDIEEKDLDLLTNLPNLEYLSLGGAECQTRLSAKGVLPRLAKLSSLKRLWLDGIKLSRNERATLERRYEFLRT